MPRTTLRSQFTPEQRAASKPVIVARNTFQYLDGDVKVLRLHSTDILRIMPDGRVKLDSGGWQTVTTKDRMNRFLPAAYRIVQERGQWFVTRWYENDCDRIPYYDGMILPDAFNKRAAGDKLEKANAKLTKEINSFVRKLDKLDKLPMPGGGDCWYCHLFQGKVEPGAEHKGDTEHLLQHIREGYIHGSLLVNAMRWAGYQDAGISSYYLHSKPGSRQSIKSALRRYLRRHLGLPA